MSPKIAALICLAALSACATKKLPLGGAAIVAPLNELPAPVAQDVTFAPRPYAIGPRDKLTITALGLAETPTVVEAQVDAGGNISFPLAGSIVAAGKTTPQVAEELRAALRRAFVRSPEVTVNLTEINSQTITVDGQVVEPGLYPAAPGMTLVKAIASAKGLAEFAKLEDVVVFRTVGGQKMAAVYNLAAIRRGNYADPELYPNDLVVVGDSPSRRLLKNLITLAPAITNPLVLLVR